MGPHVPSRVDCALRPVRNQSRSWESSLRVTEPKVVVRAWLTHTVWTAGAPREATILQIPTYSANGGHWELEVERAFLG